MSMIDSARSYINIILNLIIELMDRGGEREREERGT